MGWLSDALVKHAQIAGKQDFSELSEVLSVCIHRAINNVDVSVPGILICSHILKVSSFFLPLGASFLAGLKNIVRGSLGYPAE